MPATIRPPIKVKAHRAKTSSAKAPSPRQEPPASRTGKLLVATDGSRAASAALRVAATLAARDGREVEVVTVFEPLPVPAVGFDLTRESNAARDAIAASTLDRIRRQLRASGGADWPLHIDYGRPAPVIDRVARESGAEMIVLGLGHHGVMARLFASETVLRVLRLTNLPVLAVHPRARTLPRRIVVGVDFGESSIRAARAALALLERPGHLHLVHARADWWGFMEDHEAWEQIYTDGVRDGFQRLILDLGVPPEIGVTTEIASGMAPEVLHAAGHGDKADIVAVGSHGHPLIDRLLVGTVPTVLVRDADTSVLVAPPANTWRRGA